MLAALLAFTLNAMPAFAQGVFDLGAISREMTGSGQAAPPATPATIDTYAFSPSPGLRAQNLDKFMKTLISMDPGFAGQLEGIDLVDLIGQEIAKYGLSTANVADAYTVYFITAFDVANGRTETESQAQIDGTRAMVLETMQSVGGVASLGDGDRQSLAEGLILQAALFDAISGAVENDAALKKKVQTDVRNAALEMGLDLSQFRMGPNGLARN